jgi:hypothetical protein
MATRASTTKIVIPALSHGPTVQEPVRVRRA